MKRVRYPHIKLNACQQHRFRLSGEESEERREYAVQTLRLLFASAADFFLLETLSINILTGQSFLFNSVSIKRLQIKRAVVPHWA